MPREQVFDLADAVHNLPVDLRHSETFDEKQFQTLGAVRCPLAFRYGGPAEQMRGPLAGHGRRVARHRRMVVQAVGCW